MYVMLVNSRIILEKHTRAYMFVFFGSDQNTLD